MAKKRWDEDTEQNVQGVVNEKSKWQAAYEKGDEEAMTSAAENAKKYYKGLTDSGNYDLSKELATKGYSDAKNVLDNYKGLNGEKSNRSLANENIETATDTANAQSGFANEFKDMWSEGYKKQEERIDSDPMDTKAAKAIMERYTNLGEGAREDTLADGSVRNDGNLDSFTKANADSQRQAYEKAGIESVFDLHERNVEAGGQNYRDMLSGGEKVGNEYSKAVEEANATASNATDIENANRQNDVSVFAQEADITGKVPEKLSRKHNVYFDDDGELINENLDYQAIIDGAEARGDEETVRAATEARAHKIAKNPDYAQYAPTMTVPENEKQTEAGRQFDESVRLEDKQIDANERMNREQNRASLQIQRENNALELRKLALEYEAAGMTNVANALRSEADKVDAKSEESEWASKRETISEIVKTYPVGEERNRALSEAGITSEDLDRYSAR